MKLKKFFSILMLIAVAALAGCQSSAQGSQSIPEASVLPMPSAETSALPQNQTLNISMPAGVSVLDPLRTKDQELLDVMSLIYEPALRIDATGRPQSGIINSINYDSEDNNKLICQLRDDVTFHTGEQVKAEDIVAELKYILTLDADVCSYSTYKSVVDDVQADETDEYKFSITLNERSSDIYYLLNFPVVSQTSFHSGSENAVGTGSYKIDSFSTNEGLVLSRNENWWRAQPSFSTIVAKPYADEDARKQAYISGEIDVMPASKATVKEMKGYSDTVVYNITTPYYDCILLNHSNSLFSSSKIRSAMSSCINRSAIISGALSGAGLASNTALRPDYWYFENMPVDAYSKSQAQAALDSAGTTTSEDEYGNEIRNYNGAPMEFTVIYTESTEEYYRKTVLELVRTQLSEFGITMNIGALSADEYESRLKSGNFDAAFGSYYTKNSQDISFFFGSDDYSNASSSELSSAINTATQSLEPEAQSTAFNSLQQLLQSDMPHIGLYFRETMLVVRSNITNVTAMYYQHAYDNINAWEYKTETQAVVSSGADAAQSASQE